MKAVASASSQDQLRKETEMRAVEFSFTLAGQERFSNETSGSSENEKALEQKNKKIKNAIESKIIFCFEVTNKTKGLFSLMSIKAKQFFLEADLTNFSWLIIQVFW